MTNPIDDKNLMPLAETDYYAELTYSDGQKSIYAIHMAHEGELHTFAERIGFEDGASQMHIIFPENYMEHLGYKIPFDNLKELITIGEALFHLHTFNSTQANLNASDLQEIPTSSHS